MSSASRLAFLANQAAADEQAIRDADTFRDLSRSWNDADWELWADCQELGLPVRPAVWTGPLVPPVVDADCPF